MSDTTKLDGVLPDWFLTPLRTLSHDCAERSDGVYVHVVGSGHVYRIRSCDRPQIVVDWVCEDDATRPSLTVHEAVTDRPVPHYFTSTQWAPLFTAICRGNTYHEAGDLCAWVNQQAQCDADGRVTLTRVGELVRGARLVAKFGYGEPWWRPTGPQLVASVLAGTAPANALIDFILENIG